MLKMLMKQTQITRGEIERGQRFVMSELLEQGNLLARHQYGIGEIELEQSFVRDQMSRQSRDE